MVGIVFLVIAVTILLFLAKISLRSYSDSYLSGFEVGGIVIPVLQTFVIIFFESIFRPIVLRFTQFENHRTDKEYENALISKIMLFRFVNNYTALFYIAFVKPFIQDFDACTANDCMKELQISLGTIFFTKLIFNMAATVLSPIFKQVSVKKAEPENGER
jgi:hypothetical protein